MKYQRYLENGIQNTISFFINSMEDEYLFELDYEDSCSILHTTKTTTMADDPPPAKQNPKADLTDAKTMADGPPPSKPKPKADLTDAKTMADDPPPSKQKPKADLTDAKTMADGPPTAKNKPWDSNLKKHAKTHHLPIYLESQMVCWTCEKFVGGFGCLKQFHLHEHPKDNVFREEYLQWWYSQINFLLHTLSQKITGTDNLQGLLHFVLANKIYPALDKQQTAFTSFELSLMSGLQHSLQQLLIQPQISPPNQIISLLHWRILLNLFLHLTPQDQDRLKKFNVGQQFETQPQLHKLFTDSHFHLDTLLDKLKVNTLKEVQDKHQQDHSLDFAIANYVYPEKWHKILADMTSNTNIMYTIGVHPHRIFYPNQFSVQNILKHLKNPKCVGVSEIGLDYTTKCNCKHHHNALEQQQCTERKIQAQQHFLDKLPSMIQDIDTVIVIHTRGECASETVRKCLLHFNLQNKQIHRHCFTGDTEEANLWMSSFKHIKLSISSIILNSKQLQESVQTIPSSQLMLESDSPHLSPSPWNIPQHTALLASLKNMPLSLFNHLTSSNTRALYYIPSLPPKQQPHPQNTPKSTLFNKPTIQWRNCIPFNGANTPFSNFFPCNLTYQKQSFHNIEQIYQWVKSIDIGNHYIASEIWQLTDGYAIKKCSNILPLPTVEQ